MYAAIECLTQCRCCCCYVTSVVSDSGWPHGRQPTRLPSPWDSPGKNSGVGCHLILQCIKVKVTSQSCPTLSDPMDCSLPGSSVHGIFQARVLDRGAIAFSTMQVGHSKSFLGVRLLQVLCKVIESVIDFAEESQRTEYSLSPQGFSSVVTNQSPK